jgi:hypothetical protein
MRLHVTQVFDDAVVGTGNVYTSPEFEELLGLADRSAIQAVADQVSGTTPTLTVSFEHGTDGRNWSAKNGTAEINAQALVSNATNNLTGTEAGSNPSHGRARLRIALAGTTPQARLRIYVTGRTRVT